MVAPSIWLYEIANGLTVAARRGRLAPNVGLELLDHFAAIGVQLSEPDIKDCYRLAFRHGVAVYDATYLGLAVALEVPLWTADSKFFRAVQFQLPFVRWIGDYRSD